MSEENTNTIEEYDEFNSLRIQARQLGIKFGPATKIETLRKKIQEVINPDWNKDYIEQKKKYIDQNKALVRVKITDYDPADINQNGIYITFANQVLGKMRYYVPIAGVAAESWHLPRAIVNVLKDMKYTKKQVNANNKKKPISWVNAPKFLIEELPPLTKEELEELAIKQKATLAESD